MKYNISTFTHIGTKREINQDRVLVNDIILDNNFHHIIEQPACFCFVADGIGGSVRGEIASQFVLDKILEQKAAFMQIDEQFLESELNNINEELIAYAHQNPEFFGTGTTLNGLIINENNRFVTINAGDSEMWVLRNDMFFQLTELQVFDDAEPGSPLISYFGGKSASLELDLTAPLREIHKDDIFLIASDGLLNALVPKDVKAILLSRQSLQQKSELLLKNALSKGADDNVSCIVVELI
jgi:protein phosphatase